MRLITIAELLANDAADIPTLTTVIELAVAEGATSFPVSDT
ncbi:hypothetical protein DFR37_10468 [Eoetvoesiella caeni]|uniref:Uncharacterized protein n=1 Tax=Eoetvoesiella caeni TaxID=645616 RepID=A0A366HCB6_9BURK|nr:hypothetical protein DFR37_10468 [Eoetvoesiella caeni]